MPTTTNLLLPKLTEGQSQKEVTVNTGLDYLDGIIAGYLALSVAGAANVTLTETQSRNRILKFTGVLTGSINVIVPTRTRDYLVVNGTTGLFSLTVKTVAGTGVDIPQTFGMYVYCDGTNIVSGLPESRRVVEANVAVSGAPNVLLASESGKLLTNEGAPARNYHTLPPAAAGLIFQFACQDADGMRIKADTGDTIRVATGVTAAAGYIENGAQGDMIILEGINATEWWDMGSRGTWTPT